MTRTRSGPELDNISNVDEDNLLQTQELQKYLLEFDVDNDGMLDFEEFKLAIKTAQCKLKNQDQIDRESGVF